MRRFSFKIIGINKIAPAGGKNILVLLIAVNNITQARAVHTNSGIFKYILSIILIKQPVNALNVIKAII